MSWRTRSAGIVFAALLLGALQPMDAAAADPSPSGACMHPTTDAGAPTGAPVVESPVPGPCTSPVPASSGSDACFLVTTAEIEGIFQRQLTMPPGGSSVDTTRDCLWSFSADATDMAALWLGEYDGWESLAGLGAVPVPGLGDEALWVLDGLLWVRSGDTAFTVAVISSNLDPMETAIAIATAALPRIP